MDRSSEDESSHAGSVASGSENRFTVAVKHVLVLIGAMVVLSGCQSGGRAYGIPDEFCGYEVSEQVISPLLPEGESLNDHSRKRSGSIAHCRLGVDERMAISVDVEQNTGPLDPVDMDPAKFKDGTTVNVPFAQSAITGSERARVVAQCGDLYPWMVFDFSFYSPYGGESEQRVADVAGFVEDFVASVNRGLRCAAQ
ncbi:hypothetical protein ABZ705_15325 [Streptomyces sp. NPDC006984]|uniref:hypothetical protein n=1 Tax=Streptomyces sp. NPDC006984 TaxID=3155463 RepID=UPI0034021B31